MLQRYIYVYRERDLISMPDNGRVVGNMGERMGYANDVELLRSNTRTQTPPRDARSLAFPPGHNCFSLEVSVCKRKTSDKL